MAQNLDKEQPKGEIQVNIDDENALDATLQVALFRQDCPDTMILEDYEMGLLAEQSIKQITDHISRCPHCQAELARLDDFSLEISDPMQLLSDVMEPIPLPDSAEPSPTWQQEGLLLWKQIQHTGAVMLRLAGEALSASLGGGLTPQQALAGSLRGRGSLELSLKEGIEDFETFITVETGWEDPNHCAVVVKVDIPSRGGWPNLADTAVILKRDDVTMDERMTNAFGLARFEKVATAELTELTFEITPPPQQ